MAKCTKECLSCHKYVEPLLQVCPYCAGKRFIFPGTTSAGPAEKAMEQAIKFERMGDPEKAEDWLNKAASLEQKYGKTAKISFVLYCPRCDKSVSEEHARMSSQSYDDGWFIRRSFFCPKCDSELYGPDGTPYKRTDQL